MPVGAEVGFIAAVLAPARAVLVAVARVEHLVHIRQQATGLLGLPILAGVAGVATTTAAVPRQLRALAVQVAPVLSSSVI